MFLLLSGASYGDRDSQAFRCGSTQDWGLSIDRAWWRTHHDRPGRHYPDLYAICTDVAEHLAQQIDHAGAEPVATLLTVAAPEDRPNSAGNTSP